MKQTHTKANHYQLVETKLQEKLPKGLTRCNLCLWRCKIGHGQRGFCQAHVNRNGTLYNLSYGIISAIELNAIEEKPVKHFQAGSQVLSVGSYGCNFRCGGCHNLEISWGTEALDALARGQSTAAYVTPEELVAIALDHGAQGIAFTYSEPAVWLEYIIDVAQTAKAKGLYTVYVSNSYVTDEALEIAAPYIDVLCSDIKSMDDSFYKAICKPASSKQVLNMIEKAQQLGIHVETRTNIIPGKNDSSEQFKAIAQWIKNHLGSDSPWHITKFFPAYKLAHLSETPDSSLFKAHDIARSIGLTNVYVYNEKGCDCAKDNIPLADFLNKPAQDLYTTKQCPAECCGSDGILLKKYEQTGKQE